MIRQDKLIERLEREAGMHFQQAMRNGQAAQEYKAEREALLNMLKELVDDYGVSGVPAYDRAKALIREVESRK